jgi:hypothetical protein
MKKYLLFLATVAFACTMHTAKAQIVSASADDMEVWNPDPANASANDPNVGFTPAGWQCLNVLSSFLTGNSPISCFEENSIVHSGSHSCKLKSTVFTATSYNYIKALFKHDTCNVLFTGTILTSPSPSIVPGAPFTSRTSAINFWYQYFPQNNNAKPDTASCGVVLTKNHAQIGSGYMTMNSAASWTNGNVNITYTALGNPDTIIVIFSSSSQVAPAPGSLLYIDGVTAAAPLAVNEIGSIASVGVYPNPASSQVNFRITGENAKTIKVYDITGKELNTYVVKSNELNLNTSGFANGLYIYQAYDVNGGLIKVGKFNIEK